MSGVTALEKRCDMTEDPLVRDTHILAREVCWRLTRVG
jgi:hypothetical protein